MTLASEEFAEQVRLLADRELRKTLAAAGERRADDQGGIGAERQHVSIRLRVDHLLGSDAPACTRTVLGNDAGRQCH